MQRELASTQEQDEVDVHEMEILGGGNYTLQGKVEDYTQGQAKADMDVADLREACDRQMNEIEKLTLRLSETRHTQAMQNNAGWSKRMEEELKLALEERQEALVRQKSGSARKDTRLEKLFYEFRVIESAEQQALEYHSTTQFSKVGREPLTLMG